LFGAFIFLPKGLDAQHASNQKLFFEADTLYFNPVFAGEEVNLAFKFKVVGGKGKSKTKIHQVYTGCSCTATDYNDDSLNVGDQGVVNLLFKSKEWGADTGLLVNKHIYVLYNGGSQVIYFIGRVFSKDTSALLRLNSTLHDFKRIPKRIPVWHTFVLHNDNSNPVQVLNIKRSSSGLNVKWSKRPIESGDSTVIEVKLTPSFPGVFHKSMTLVTNLGNRVIHLKGIVEE